MGQDYNYSYTQPSQSESYGLNSTDSRHSETELNILLDQAQLNAQRHQYPPQPEVEFGFPKVCYCGAQPILSTSRNDTGRKYYTCENVEDGDCNVWKWWDVAVMEEMREMATQNELLASKVDYLTYLTDYETQLNQVKDLQTCTEQKVLTLEKQVTELGKKNSMILFGVSAITFVVVAMILMFK